MKKLIPFLFLLLSGCRYEDYTPYYPPACPMGTAGVCDDCSMIGSSCAPRFLFDPHKNFLSISIWGDFVASPDGQSVVDLLEEAKHAGLLNDYSLVAYGVEGNGTYCAEIASDADRYITFKLFAQLPMDPHSYYRVWSVADCSEAGSF